MHSEPERDTAIQQIIQAQPRRIDGFDVARALPVATRRSVGPFVFFDHMGTSSLPAGSGLDVRPHPHINLATVTYLFEGSIFHRDSLGSARAIEPGAINWMTAGRGIVHSERTPPEARASGPHLHGLQLWVALPQREEEREPSFSHHACETLPELSERGVKLKLLAGEAYGARAPVPVLSPLFYVDVRLEAGARFALPREYSERAAYVIEGEVSCGSTTLAPRALAVFAPGAPAELSARSAARIALIGGEPLDGPRYIFWNFVSSSKERIEEATRAWKAGEFPKVPGDEHEHIPLDADPHFK
jgi:redox-sensitive bicupin YhaK (pirin superfamily)